MSESSYIAPWYCKTADMRTCHVDLSLQNNQPVFFPPEFQAACILQLCQLGMAE